MSMQFIKKRQKARKYALQALYSWNLSHNNLNDIEKHILDNKNADKIDLEFLKTLIHEIPANLNNINETIKHHVNIPLEKLDPIELVILQMATFELMECKDTPYKVVINEALELSKKFGATDSYKFINGVLDKLARELQK